MAELDGEDGGERRRAREEDRDPCSEDDGGKGWVDHDGEGRRADCDGDGRWERAARLGRAKGRMASVAADDGDCWTDDDAQSSGAVSSGWSTRAVDGSRCEGQRARVRAERESRWAEDADDDDGLSASVMGSGWSTRAEVGESSDGQMARAGSDEWREHERLGRYADRQGDGRSTELEESERTMSESINCFGLERGNDHSSSPIEAACDIHIDELQEAGDVSSGALNLRKKGRGFSTSKFFRHKGEGRHQLEWNKYGQAVGENASKLRAACAFYARCSWLWPIDKKWKEMPTNSWTETWELLKDDFDLSGHANASNFVFDLIHVRCKGWKSRVKSIWMAHEKKPQVLKEKLSMDPRIDKVQFANAVRQWSTPDSKAKALINRKNRKMKALDHRCGRRSLAAQRHEFEKEKNREPTDVDMMKIMYPNEEILEELEERIQRFQQNHPQMPFEELPFKKIVSEAYSHFVGTGKRDYIYFVGTGHEKMYKGFEREKLQASLQKTRDEQESVKKLQDIIASKNLIIQQQNTSMQELRNWVQQLSQYVGFSYPHPYPQDVSDSSGASGSGSRNNASPINRNRNNGRGGFHDSSVMGAIPSASSDCPLDHNQS